MSLITDLITHIDTNKTLIKTVDHAWTMQPVDDFTGVVPAVYVSLGNSSSSPSSTSPIVIQQSRKEINIYIVCQSADLESLISEVNSLVLGWQYDSQHTQMEHRSGTPQDINGKYIWYLESFSTEYLRRST